MEIKIKGIEYVAKRLRHLRFALIRENDWIFVITSREFEHLF